jgi:(p)ppGpp synthase/HD superfamily hydrolase
MIKQVLEFATGKHAGQIRKFEKTPYIEHPKKVATIIKENKESKNILELISAAILHDTLEDTNTTEQELKKHFGELITSIVKELTTDEKEKEKIGKKKYLANKMESMSSWALAIKLADRLDNVSDLNNSSSEFKKRYIEETNYILEKIEENRKLSETHKKIIKKIKEKIK